MLRPKIIVFLSTGDTCRSPMAAARFRHLLDKHRVRGVEVRTAGVSTIVGLLASQETIQILKAEELDAERHRSNQLTPELLRRAHLVLGMTPFHVQSALRLNEEARGKVHLLKEFTRSDLKNIQINDPMGGTLEVYRRCYLEIKAAVDRLIFLPNAVGMEVKPIEEPKPKAKTPAKPAPKPEEKAAPKPAAKKPTTKKSTSKPAAKSKPASKPKAKTTSKGAAKVKSASKRAKPASKRAKPNAKSTAAAKSRSTKKKTAKSSKR